MLVLFGPHPAPASKLADTDIKIKCPGSTQRNIRRGFRGAFCDMFARQDFTNDRQSAFFHSLWRTRQLLRSICELMASPILCGATMLMPALASVARQVDHNRRDG